MALYRQGKPEEAITQFERAIGFDASTGTLQMIAALGGAELQQESRFLNPLCISLCKLRMGDTGDANYIFEKLPAPENATGTYAEFYAEAQSAFRDKNQWRWF